MYINRPIASEPNGLTSRLVGHLVIQYVNYLNNV